MAQNDKQNHFYWLLWSDHFTPTFLQESLITIIFKIEKKKVQQKEKTKDFHLQFFLSLLYIVRHHLKGTRTVKNNNNKILIKNLLFK